MTFGIQAPILVVMGSTALAAQQPDPAGGVTLQQFVEKQEARIMAADSDGDGKVSQAEFEAAMKSGRGDPAARFARLDTNHDGMLDKGEIDAMLAMRFHRLDTNGDGILTTQERMAARTTHRQQGDTPGS